MSMSMSMSYALCSYFSLFAEAEMRKEALAISSDVDNLARRRQKLLDRKKKGESKGKAVAHDQPPKGESVDLATDFDITMLKVA